MRHTFVEHRGGVLAISVAVAATLFAGSALAQRNSKEQTAAEQAAAQREAERAAKQKAAEEAAAALLNGLAPAVQKSRQEERKTAQEREARFRAAFQRQQKKTADAVARRNAAEARGNALDREWNANEAKIKEVTELLQQRQGNLGELFGVTRQVAGDAATTLQDSLLSAQFGKPADGSEERSDFLRRLAGAKALPSIDELRRLWYELVREMTDAGKVVQFNASVLQPDGTRVERQVVRVGPFTAVSNGDYLGYLPSERSLTTLSGQLAGQFRDIARRLQDSTGQGGYREAVVDPASGSIIGLYLTRPDWVERVEQGEVVGYVIVAVGVIGALLALFQAVYLVFARLAVSAQLKHLDKPKANNALGRVLLAFHGGGSTRLENPELAELREVPTLERFQSFLRLAVAAGPLLGLIGTVIGMIITFRAIVASGTSDPKVMAHGIGTAMIATVLGLGIAIPLLFINTGLATLSRGVIQILDEQSNAMLAADTDERKQST